MTFIRTVLAFAAALFLAACTIESDTVMPDPTAAGDPIPGFPLDRSFELEAFETGRQSYKAFATLTPDREGERVRYIVHFNDGTPNRLVVHARKMSGNNYLVRFAQTIEGMRPSLRESGLGFVSVRDGHYFMMTSMSDDGRLEDIFGRDALPRGAGTSTLTLDTIEQAEKISAWFAAHSPELSERKDYTKFRVVGAAP